MSGIPNDFYKCMLDQPRPHGGRSPPSTPRETRDVVVMKERNTVLLVEDNEDTGYLDPGNCRVAIDGDAES